MDEGFNSFIDYGSAKAISKERHMATRCDGSS